MKKILVVILNYRTYKMTLNLIKELNYLDTSLFDILVIDNCSKNESADILNKYAKKYNYSFIKNSSNSGYASGNNIGIRQGIDLGYEYTLILNNDLKIIDKDFINKIYKKAEDNKNIACIGPKIYDINQNVVAPYVNRPTFYTLTLGLIKEKKIRSKYENEICEVYRVFGCCMLLRNSAMNQIDCFDERTFLYCEEEILAEKLLKHNLITMYFPEASILHMESSTVGKKRGISSLAKIKVINKSLSLYLDEYRKFNYWQRRIIIAIRDLLIFLKG